MRQDRRAFLVSAGAGFVALTLPVRPARAGRRSDDHERAAAFLSDHFVADFHAHPVIKTAFFNRSMHDSHRAPRGTTPFTLRTNLPSLRAAHVDAVFSSVYVPEKELGEDACAPVKLASISPSARRAWDTWDEPSHDVALRMMDSVESDIAGTEMQLARTNDELDAILDGGGRALLHAVEGAHALGRPNEGATEDELLERLDAFHRRGVCLMTPAHFYDVGIAPNIQGVPKNWYLKAMRSFRANWSTEGNRDPLPDIGKSIIDRMAALGMLIDVTHMGPGARHDVYTRVPSDVPVVMTHVGHRDLADFDMNPDPAEVREIAQRGGVIGVIFLKYFLNGTNRGRGIVQILDTMERLVADGGPECVAWGSDFDGVTNPPNDLRMHAHLPRLVDGMLDRFGPEVTAQILGGNLRALLRRGWRGAES